MPKAEYILQIATNNSLYGLILLPENLIFMRYNIKSFIAAIALPMVIFSCNDNGTTGEATNDSARLSDNNAAGYDTTFKVEAESFADLQVLRYQVPGFEQLPLQQKQLAYYLYEAALMR